MYIEDVQQVATGIQCSLAAKRMKTSRMALDRLLDPNNISITLKSIENAVISLGKRVHIEIRNS